jgi:E3 ubiquitin-protein ligase TRIP12
MPNGTGPSESADDDLPSVMTCANYLKLPPYSTKVLYLVIKMELTIFFLSC